VELDGIKDRIRKLLNLAKDNSAADGEIENAMRFAARLMDSHNLSEADVQGQPAVAEERAERMGTYKAFLDGTSIARWEGRLAVFVAELIGGIDCYEQGKPEVAMSSFGTVQFDQDGRPRVAKCVVYFGDAELCALAADLYSELRLTIAATARLKYGSVFKGTGFTYAVGFVVGLFDRLRADRAKDVIALPASTTNSHALAIITPEQRARIAAMNAKKVAAANEWLRDEADIKIATTKVRAVRCTPEQRASYIQGAADGRNHAVARPTRRPKLT
jgi:hypothetical protein